MLEDFIYVTSKDRRVEYQDLQADCGVLGNMGAGVNKLSGGSAILYTVTKMMGIRVIYLFHDQHLEALHDARCQSRCNHCSH